MTTQRKVSWVVYQVPLRGNMGTLNAICEQAEWERMESDRPGYHTLVQAGIQTESEAERLARGTSGDALPKPSRKNMLHAAEPRPPVAGGTATHAQEPQTS
jgi:hypothetical protein